MSRAASTVETWAMILGFFAAHPAANFVASAISPCSSAGVSGVASTPPMKVSSSRSPTQSIGEDRPDAPRVEPDEVVAAPDVAADQRARRLADVLHRRGAGTARVVDEGADPLVGRARLGPEHGQLHRLAAGVRVVDRDAQLGALAAGTAGPLQALAVEGLQTRSCPWAASAARTSARPTSRRSRRSAGTAAPGRRTGSATRRPPPRRRGVPAGPDGHGAGGSEAPEHGNPSRLRRGPQSVHEVLTTAGPRMSRGPAVAAMVDPVCQRLSAGTGRPSRRRDRRCRPWPHTRTHHGPRRTAGCPPP